MQKSTEVLGCSIQGTEGKEQRHGLEGWEKTNDDENLNWKHNRPLLLPDLASTAGWFSP